MNVTSLLNANSVAAERQEKKLEEGESSRTPSRNRTPWDAGGYSLPINTISNSTPTTPPQHQHIHHDDSYPSMPTSPRHKFSDSRSSLSSFTSSSHSTTHSRFSSMSTIASGNHSLSSLAENLSPTSGLKLKDLELGPLPSIESIEESTACPPPRGSLSPAGSLEALAMAAENRIADRQVRSTTEDKMSTTPEQTPNAIPALVTERPSSPSDAVLIKRAVPPSLRVVTGDQELNEIGQAHVNKNFLSAPLETYHRSLVHSRSHKRALSAPDFTASLSTFPTAESVNMGPRAEPTPPLSYHPDNPSPTDTTAYPNPDTPPMTTADAESHAVVCMYIPNCDTGSQPRKAISHIFGRNKMCTRLIPQQVWVHYCRKHYQRSRYRNPKEYAKLQCDLVQQQIRRVHDWSLNNAKNGLPGTVQDWGLAVRKREQKRLDDLNGARKRSAAVFEHDSDEGENEDDGNGRGIAVPATAVPGWLLALCGKGYSTQAILSIFNRLHTEILDDIIPCFPDIEILPNIVVDQEEPKSPKGYTKRTSVGHKRSQSLGGGSKPEYYTHNRRSSQPSTHGQDSNSYDSSTQKRRRPNGMNESISPDRNAPSFQRSRLAERPLELGRRIQQLSHRPVFPDIDEHQAGEDELHAYSPQQYQPLLRAPTPQRLNQQSMAAHLEINNGHGHGRRPTHQRSRSDIGGFGRGPYGYSSAPSSVYSHEGYQYPRPAHFQESPQLTDSYPHTQAGWKRAPVKYSSMSELKNAPRLGHNRTRSSSMVRSTYPPTMPSQKDQGHDYSQSKDC